MTNENGRGPLTIDAAQLIGNAVAAALAEQLPRALAGAQIRAQIPAQFKCLTCITRRAAWMIRHQPEVQAAQQTFLQMTAEWPPDDPRRGQVNLLMFLPAELHPTGDPANPNPDACPDVMPGDVLVNGTGYCAEDAPGVQQAKGGQPLLIANAPLSAALVAEAMGQGQAA